MSGQTHPEVLDVADRAGLPAALGRLGIAGERPVLVSVGGAAGMDEHHVRALHDLLREHLVPVLSRHGVLVVDGGTHSGVMRVMGEAVDGTDVVLLGVAATGTVVVPGRNPANPDAAPLDPHHRAVLLVPGTHWGDESPWIAAVSDLAAGSSPSATLLVNGGTITFEDARHSVGVGRPVIVVAGTGRAADEIVAATRGTSADERAVAIVASGLVHVVNIESGGRAAATVEALLTRGTADAGSGPAVR